MHFLGLAGMPRRYIDYPDAFWGWNFCCFSKLELHSADCKLLELIELRSTKFNTRKIKYLENWWNNVGVDIVLPPEFHTFSDLPK